MQMHCNRRIRHRPALLLTLLLLLVTSGIASGAPPRNVILLIGDCMGFEQVKAAGMYIHGQPGTIPFEYFPHQGQVTTHSANSSVTDSAAAATAIATGFKVNNDVVSVAIPGDGDDLAGWIAAGAPAGMDVGIFAGNFGKIACP